MTGVTSSTTVQSFTATEALAIVNLPQLMERTSGRPEVVVGLIDGPVAAGLSSLASENIRLAPGVAATCSQSNSAACMHGTFVAGILSARRSALAPAICPDCTLLVRPIFQEVSGSDGELMPRATPEELATAIVQSVEAGAHVLNLSVALAWRSARGERALQEALDWSMKRGTVVVVAAGNWGLIGSSVITAHPWVIPVAAYSLMGRPLNLSNLGASIGTRGLGAPGERVVSLTPEGKPVARTGTSVAAPFVTGAIALLWSQFPKASAVAIRTATTQATARRRSIAPPLLNAWGAHIRIQELL